MTFRAPAPLSVEAVAPLSPFARVSALSLGDVAGPEEIAERARALSPRRVFVHAGSVKPRDELARGLDEAGRERLAARVADEAAQAIADALSSAGVSATGVSPSPTDATGGGAVSPGDLVLDVFTAPGGPLWLGVHRHAAGAQPWPSGRLPFPVPAEAPSRAWAKLEEALAWSGVALRPGETAVEIGSAPGGASFALLSRGLSVVGVDPGEMDARVLADPRFRHVQQPVGALSKGDLPARVDWIAMDVNLAPPVALRYLERVVGPRRAHLRGAILTLKLNDAAMAAKLPDLLERVRAIVPGEPLVTQLPSNRSEVCVVVSCRPIEGRGVSGASRAARGRRASR